MYSDMYSLHTGLEKVPKLDPSLLQPLHLYITTINLHPVGVCIYMYMSCNNYIKVCSHLQITMSSKLGLMTYMS